MEELTNLLNVILLVLGAEVLFCTFLIIHVIENESKKIQKKLTP